MNHYTLLKISPAAGQDEVESAFRDFKLRLKRYGPDLELTDEHTRQQFPHIWMAYAVLLDPELRKAYDFTVHHPPHAVQKTAETEKADKNVSDYLTGILVYIGIIVFAGIIMYVVSGFFRL